MSYGHMLKTVGRQAEGIDAYRKAIDVNPNLGEAWWSLANLKTVKFDDGDIAAMEQRSMIRTSGGGPLPSRVALGKAIHDPARGRRRLRPFCGGQCASPE